jgi:hypothetical protein
MWMGYEDIEVGEYLLRTEFEILTMNIAGFMLNPTEFQPKVDRFQLVFDRMRNAHMFSGLI